MTKVNGTTITMTRGDTLRISISLSSPNGKKYTPDPGDSIRFAAKRRYVDARTILYKVIPNDTLLLELEPEDTKSLSFGAYVYDIQITFADGRVDTVIDRAQLIITEEVD